MGTAVRERDCCIPPRFALRGRCVFSSPSPLFVLMDPGLERVETVKIGLMVKCGRASSAVEPAGTRRGPERSHNCIRGKALGSEAQRAGPSVGLGGRRRGV